MNARSLVGAVLAVLVGVGVYALWPKEKLSPEDEVRHLIAQMVKSAEKRDASGVVEGLSEDFKGQGSSSKQEIKQLLVGQFFRAQALTVLNPLLEVNTESPTAAHFKGTFVFARDGAAPDAAKYVLEGDVEKRGDDWKIVSIHWQR
ncbi:MAG: hypothetical protein ACO1OB_31580 [Archangium sp.]